MQILSRFLTGANDSSPATESGQAGAPREDKISTGSLQRETAGPGGGQDPAARPKLVEIIN